MKQDQTPRIMIIDDDKGVIHTLSRLVEKMGLEADHSLTLTQGMEKAATTRYDIILLDVRLPDGNGLDAIEILMETDPPPQVIIMTAYSDPDGAALAIESGAWDYIRKPASPKNVELQILRALQYQEQKRQSEQLPKFDDSQIIGSGKRIRDCLGQAARIAGSDANVLITGETGTGKELFAKAIHRNSRRKDHDIIVVDCSVLTDNLIESVLFGHEKGAFTGADRKRHGLAKLADGGTLFLDEVGELPESIQSSFLRMLQEKKFRPVGSSKEIHSDFRVISATNKDLDAMVSRGRFRRDLLFRLNSFTLPLPPLRERTSDILDIARHYTDQFCRQNQVPPKEFSQDFEETLQHYDWPGNARELVNTIDVCVASTFQEDVLFAYHLPQSIRSKVTRMANTPAAAPQSDICETPLFTRDEKLKDVLEKTEKAYLETLYARVNGDIPQLCHISGISRAVLYRKLKKYRVH
ncbi:MAG TPA: Fis family transcriptional regulator [Desulfobacteraceae bacterium]|nr:Fis family transcriptional regulator [Desulfobacteraceae bacterium]|tara:strand:+ start:390 stop:1790 length:1401 start_codon:yes stop_codon:yes gene_type:complete